MDGTDARIPGSLQLVLDFVNSVEFQVEEDAFGTPDQLAAWLAQRRLLSAGTRLTATDRETARTIREGLRAVLHLHASHEADLPAIDRMNAALAAATVHFSIGPSGDPELVAAGEGNLTSLTNALVNAIATAHADGTWQRLKACARESCQWAFYDASRNRSGRWCSMAGCGNYIKMRRVAERRAESITGDRPRARGTGGRNGSVRE